MSYRQDQYKSRGRGSVSQRLGLPIRSDRGYNRGGRGGYGRGGNYQRGRGGGERGTRGPRRGGYHNEGRYQRQVVDRVPQKQWFKIVVIRGSEFGREFIFKALSDYIDVPLWPVLYKTLDDGNTAFFVDDKGVADAIAAASRRVDAPNGLKLVMKVHPSQSLYVPLTQDEQEAIKAALQHRYDAVNLNLDLSKFSFDSAFEERHAMNISLQRNNVLMTVADLIGKERAAAESIRSIDLSQNRLRFMDYVAALVPRLPNVVRLVLHHNQVESLDELEKLSGWNLTELDVNETPLCANYGNKSAYISDIRQIFKKLTRLDGTDLPPETKFALDHSDDTDGTSRSLPPFKSSFLCDANVKDMMHEFLKLYFSIFDEDDPQKRQKLLEAYDDDTTFTMSAMNLTAASHMSRGETWSNLTRDSHNILKMEIWEKYRAKLIKRGKLAVLSYLCSDFPSTFHDWNSFIVDISFAMGNVFCVNVSGAFRERTSGSAVDLERAPLRYFNRVFLLLRNDHGLCITNEMMFVSAFSSAQYSRYMQQVELAADSSAVSVQVPMVGPSGMESVDAKSQLLEQFSKDSGMKIEWAKKCLEDFNYDYPKASAAFLQLRGENAIPPEAFI